MTLTSKPEDCGCGKNPSPAGRPVPQAPKPKSLVASGGGAHRVVYVSPNGDRRVVADMLAARAAVARGGGRIDFD